MAVSSLETSMRRSMIAWLLLPLVLLAAAPPIPGHRRLRQEKQAGRREQLSLGTLFRPEKLPARGAGLLVHFHGPAWIAEEAGAANGPLAVLSVQLGSGSAVYGKPFREAKRFGELLAEAETKAGVTFDTVGLTGWSAGYGAIRAILRHEEHYRRAGWVVLLDGLHAGYHKGKPESSRLVTADLDVYVRLARDAAAGKKRFLITHSSIVPPGYASTTECADYLIAQVGLARATVSGRGPFGLPRQSEARKGGLRIIGCSGTTKADHIDHLHALLALVKELMAR
jgi:hypothetical protein